MTAFVESTPEEMLGRKIAYFIPTLKLAGTSTQALVFCEAMTAAGYDVDLVVSEKRGVFLDQNDLFA